MNKILLGSFIVIIVLLSTAYVLNKDKQKNLDDQRKILLNNEVQRPEITINAKHQFKDGKHLFVGLVELPNPCYVLKTDVIKEDKQIVLDLKTEKNKDQVCSEVITNKEFRISFDGKIEDDIIARLNGELVNLNVFEIDPKKNIDEVEIFNKG